MKPIKFIYIVLLSLLSFFRSAETYKLPSEHNKCIILDSVTADDTYHFSSDYSSSKSVDLHCVVKKKIKGRATTLEQSTIKAPYYSNLINFKLYKKSLIYGIASIFQLERHTHLHLYQLF